MKASHQPEPNGTAAAGMPPPVSAPRRLLAKGYQGAVYLVETATGPVIVKQAMGGWLARTLRRAMLRREYRIYLQLQGVAGVPRCLGLWDDMLALEFIPGSSLRIARLSAAERTRFFAHLLDVIEAMHRAGVAHGDLKRKDNILIGPGGQPFLIDFGTAVYAPLDDAIAWRRLLFRQVQRMDLNAWVKLKYRGRLEEMTPEVAARFRPTQPERLARVVRRAWRSLTLRRRRKARRRTSR